METNPNISKISLLFYIAYFTTVCVKPILLTGLLVDFSLGLSVKEKLKIPKDLITQNSKSLVSLAVYDQHFHICL